MMKRSLSKVMSQVAMCGCLPCGGLPLAVQLSEYLSKVWLLVLGNGMYKNPVIHADYSAPDACAVGNDFYMTTSASPVRPACPFFILKTCFILIQRICKDAGKGGKESAERLTGFEPSERQAIISSPTASRSACFRVQVSGKRVCRFAYNFDEQTFYPLRQAVQSSSR